ncbi:MAG: porin family protein [Rhodothermales bacterium]
MKPLYLRVLPLCLLCALCTTSSAQSIQLGAKAGFGIANFVGDKNTDFNSKVTFVGGFPFSYEVNRNLVFTPEIVYAQKGAEALATIDNVPLELNFSVLYLEFPILAKYIFSPRRKITPIVTAGPVLSWNIDSRVRYNAVGSDTQFNEPDNSIKTLDYGVAVGGGVDFSWDLRRISIELRYTRGVTNLIDNKDDPKYNGVVALTAGIGL